MCCDEEAASLRYITAEGADSANAGAAAAARVRVNCRRLPNVSR
jgi:hypothetical protein